MDFFEQQDDARRTSKLLVPLFLLALAALVLLVNLGLFLLWSFFVLVVMLDASYTNNSIQSVSYWGNGIWIVVSLVTLVLFSIGSLKRVKQLRRSSTSVAQLLNADEIRQDTHDRDERELVNITSEMALAAGTAVPRLFVMRDEPAINAFVTGNPHQHLLIVTQGAIEQLDRSELQGLVAHEFSHLLNGDTQLNLRMMALLAGLMSISRLGKRISGNTLSPHRHSQRRSDGAPVIGGVLIMAGYGGLFIGRLIKAAVVRQREALADASARQFTRSEGLANALVKIKNGPGSLLRHPLAEDINHMCFGDAVSMHFKRLLSTHPDIDERLQQIDPSWVARARARQRQDERAQTTSSNHTPDNLQYAHQLLEQLPDVLRQRLQSPDHVCIALYALLCPDNEPPRLPAMSKEDRLLLPMLSEQIHSLERSLQLPMVELALPALQQLDDDARQHFLSNLDWLIKADNKVSLFEYLLRQLVRQQLKPTSSKPSHINRLQQCAPQVQLVLSSLIHVASDQPAQQRQLFDTQASPLLPPGRLLLPKEKCGLKALVTALQRLNGLSPLLKKPLIQACHDIVMADRQVTVAEREQLRLFCLLLDFPMPPLES